ncbi:MAG: hypothetical protein WCL02_09950 [bacterium]
MNTVKGLGIKNIVDYVLANSKLQEDEFAFVRILLSEAITFIVAKDNKIIGLGQFDCKRFSIEPPYDTKNDIIAITRFLDLCIRKLEDENITVPELFGNSDFWDECYKK